MSLFDIILIAGGGALFGVLGHVFYLELKATGKIKPAITATEAKIEGLGQILEREGQAAIERSEAFAKSFNPEAFLKQVETTMSDAGNAIVAKLQTIESEIDAKIAGAAAPVQAALDAEVADHQADLGAIAPLVDAVAAKVAPDPVA